MCRELVLRVRGPGYAVVSTQGDLASVVPVDQWVWASPAYGSEYLASVCLCPVDVEATMRAAGYDVEEDAFDYIATPIEEDGRP